MFKVPPSGCVFFKPVLFPLFFFLHTVLLIYFFFLLFIFNFSPPLCFSSLLSQDDFDPKTMFAVWVHTLGTAGGKKRVFFTQNLINILQKKNKNNLQLLFKTFPLQINRIINLDDEAATNRQEWPTANWVFLSGPDRLVSRGVAGEADHFLHHSSHFDACGRKKRKFLNELVFFRILLTRAELLAFSF